MTPPWTRVPAGEVQTGEAEAGEQPWVEEEQQKVRHEQEEEDTTAVLPFRLCDVRPGVGRLHRLSSSWSGSPTEAPQPRTRPGQRQRDHHTQHDRTLPGHGSSMDPVELRDGRVRAPTGSVGSGIRLGAGELGRRRTLPALPPNHRTRSGTGVGTEVVGSGTGDLVVVVGVAGSCCVGCGVSLVQPLDELSVGQTRAAAATLGGEAHQAYTTHSFTNQAVRLEPV